MTEINNSAPIIVTGGSGFIAGWIIKQLLDDGRIVHSTVRNPGNKQSVGHLEIIADQAPGMLKDLGLKYRPVEDTIVDHFQQLIDDKLL